jgi:GT2 family glycosyltransferase
MDAAVADVVERGHTQRAGRLFACVTNRVLERVGAIEGISSVEPPRPRIPERGPRVSVIIPTFQAAYLLERCLRSVLGQGYSEIELIVVDGGSTDGTLEMVRRVAPHAIVVTASGNPGFAAACNVGVEAASGVLLVLLNNDTELEPDAIAQMARIAILRPLRLAAVNAMTRMDGLRTVIDSLGVIVTMYGFGVPRYAGYVDFGQFAGEVRIFAASFTCVMIPRRAWQLIGPIDERYGYYYEDVDWSLRARMGGMEIHAAPSAIAYHVGSASIGPGLSPAKRALVSRNRLLCMAKVLRMRNVAGFGRRYVREDLVDLRSAVRAGDREMAKAIAGALAGAAWRMPSVYRARAPLERWHLMPDEDIFKLAAVGLPVMGPGDRPLLTAGVMRGHYAQLRSVLGDSS